MSEIDDIFTSKGKAKAVTPAALISSPGPSKKKDKNKKNKNKNKRRDNQDEPKEHPSPAEKCPSPETIIDPSTQSATTKRSRKNDNVTTVPSKRSRTTTEIKEEKQFKDSRGAGSRK
jgi:hypothetical protein